MRSERLPDELAVSVITLGELRAGVLAAAEVAMRGRRLTPPVGSPIESVQTLRRATPRQRSRDPPTPWWSRWL